MTYFDELSAFGLPRQQVARFSVCNLHYEVFFTEITKENSYDCAALLPAELLLPTYAHHYDVNFDTKSNRLNHTPFKRVALLPPGSGTRVMKCVERVIFDHYTQFNVGLYTFSPADHKLMNLYCRFISRKRLTGYTIEVGLDPSGRANVLRTPRFYDPL